MSSTENILAENLSGLQLSGPLSPPTTPPRRRKNEHKVKIPDELKKHPCSPKREHGVLLSPPVSPLPNASRSSNRDKELPEFTRRPSVSEMRTKLGLGNWICGAKRNNVDENCRLPIDCHKGTRYSKLAINTQIESVINSSLSSLPKLLWENLYKLTQLVHCIHHNFYKKRILRVQKWRALFDLEESVEEKILKTLQSYDPTCDAMNCRSSRVMGWRVKNRSKTIDIILKPDTYLDDKRLEYFLRVLKACMLCDGCINSDEHRGIEIWKEKIQRILEENICDKGSTARPVSEIPAINPVNYWEHKFDESPFDVISNVTPENHSLKFSEICKVLESDIKQKNPKPGYVYAFKDEANPGFVKIGCTTRAIEDRRKEWEDDCNRNFIPLYSSVRVPNAHRVEELCHTVLKHRNTRMYCDCCLKPHIEWFKVTPDEANAAIKRCSALMLENEPYTKSGKLKKSVSPTILVSSLIGYPPISS